MDDFQEVLSKILASGELRRPYSYNPDSTTYRNDLESKFILFQKTLDTFQKTGEIESYFFRNRQSMKGICDLILRAVDSYLSGNSGNAYKEMETLLKRSVIQKHIGHLVTNMRNYKRGPEYNTLYRVRLSESEITHRNDMFHIPFEKRHLVDTQRFSIAGIPCLYLGASIYVCWQEMGKPDLNKLYISKFAINTDNTANNINVLNLAYSPDTLIHDSPILFSDQEDWSIAKKKALIVFFPLLIACSYIRAHTPSSFAVEYIIPNLMLQWISKENNEVSGISYFSTKTQQLQNNENGVNFVFPPKTGHLQQKGFCSFLSSNFVLTKPASWQILDVFDEPQKIENAQRIAIADGNMDIGILENYRNTKFSKIENKVAAFFKLDTVNV
jgi:hypothetical protein